MRTVRVTPRLRSRHAAWFVGPCIALVLLSVGVLYATTQDSDVPLETDLAPHPGSPPPRFFGLIHLTADHVARLHFANPTVRGRGPSGPAIVRLEFLDSLGNVLLRQGPQTVMPGDVVSLDLVADGLQFPPGSNELAVRGLVTFYNPQAAGIASVQVDDVVTNSSAVLLDHAVMSPFFVKKLAPLCTHPFGGGLGWLMRINVTNAGDRGFPAARLSADLVIYLHVGQQPPKELARKPVQLKPGQSDSLVLEGVEGGSVVGTVEFTDSASRAVAAGTWQYRVAELAPLHNVYPLTSCDGAWGDRSSTSGGGATNSGGA